jgi:hypothetical protein
VCRDVGLDAGPHVLSSKAAIKKGFEDIADHVIAAREIRGQHRADLVIVVELIAGGLDACARLLARISNLLRNAIVVCDRRRDNRSNSGLLPPVTGQDSRVNNSQRAATYDLANCRAAF